MDFCEGVFSLLVLSFVCGWVGFFFLFGFRFRGYLAWAVLYHITHLGERIIFYCLVMGMGTDVITAFQHAISLESFFI